MSSPISLRNIPPHALQLAQNLCSQTGLSMADLLRQAIVSGLLVEATRYAPAQDGTLGGLEVTTLAKALRRHLSSAIDVLIEYGEYPYESGKGQREQQHHDYYQTDLHTEQPSSPQNELEPSMCFENALGDDLDMLGLGMSLANGGER